jgi:hypothetical protein
MKTTAQFEGNFVGYEPRECGEHRTVGPHRAWCFDCTEWCYPDPVMACKGCELPGLRAAAGDHTAGWLREAEIEAGKIAFNTAINEELGITYGGEMAIADFAASDVLDAAIEAWAEREARLRARIDAVHLVPAVQIGTAADRAGEFERRVRERLVGGGAELTALASARVVFEEMTRVQCAEVKQFRRMMHHYRAKWREARAQRGALWELLKCSVRTTLDVIRKPIPRWDEDPVVLKFGWQEGRCGKCGEEIRETPATGESSDDPGYRPGEVECDGGPNCSAKQHYAFCPKGDEDLPGERTGA